MAVRNFRALFVPIAILALSACTCTSDGLELERGDEGEQARATFSLQSGGDSSGTMAASLADGRQFQGPYFKITTETQVEQLAALGDGWQAEPSFVKNYNGKILASLTTAGGDRMRCQFSLAHPSVGMSGGGKGECQLTDGTTLHATFPPARPVKLLSNDGRLRERS